MKPKFKHDCRSCQFTGHALGFDVYICHDSKGKISDFDSLVARFGTDSASYYSSERITFASVVHDVILGKVGIPASWPKGRRFELEPWRLAVLMVVNASR